MPITFAEFEAARKKHGDDLVFSALFADRERFVAISGGPELSFGHSGLSFDASGKDISAKDLREGLTESGEREEFFANFGADLAVTDLETLNQAIPVIEGGKASPTEAIALSKAALAQRDSPTRSAEARSRAITTQRARARQAGDQQAGISEGLLNPENLARRRLLGGRNFFQP